MSKKIILVLFPPIINKFDFHSKEKVHFIDSGELNKSFLEKKGVGKFKADELLNLIDVDHSKEISETIRRRIEPNLILINYPHTENHFKSLNQELAKEGLKIKSIILLTVFNYELISSIQSKYLICPICEKIYQKTEVIKEDKKFVCPIDNNYQLSLEKIDEFNEQIISNYLKNSKGVIENFLRENNSSSSDIIRITINKEEEIFSGEVQKKLLSIIKDI